MTLALRRIIALASLAEELKQKAEAQPISTAEVSVGSRMKQKTSQRMRPARVKGLGYQRWQRQLNERIGRA